MLTQETKKDDGADGGSGSLTLPDSVFSDSGRGHTVIRVVAWVVTNALAAIGLASALTAGRW